MRALAVIACAPVLWMAFWGAVCVLSDPITWLLYSLGERIEYGRPS